METRTERDTGGGRKRGGRVRTRVTSKMKTEEVREEAKEFDPSLPQRQKKMRRAG